MYILRSFYSSEFFIWFFELPLVLVTFPHILSFTLSLHFYLYLILFYFPLYIYYNTLWYSKKGKIEYVTKLNIYGLKSMYAMQESIFPWAYHGYTHVFFLIFFEIIFHFFSHTHKFIKKSRRILVQKCKFIWTDVK